MRHLLLKHIASSPRSTSSKMWGKTQRGKLIFTNLVWCFMLIVVVFYFTGHSQDGCQKSKRESSGCSDNNLDGRFSSDVKHPCSFSDTPPTAYPQSHPDMSSVVDEQPATKRQKFESEGQLLSSNFTIRKGSKEWKNIFHMVNFASELRLAIKGNVFRYLKRYANPCWISRYGPPTAGKHDPYQHSAYLQQVIKNPSFYGKSRSDEVSTFIANVTARLKAGETFKPRCLPAVYLIGCSKSGTADFYQKMLMHPDIHQPGIKEPHWWTLGRFGFGSLRHQTFSTYLDNFDMAAAEIHRNTILDASVLPNGEEFHPGLTIDASVWYLFQYPWTQIPGNKGLSEPKYILAHSIKTLYPKAKILAILRQPTERLYSHWRQESPNTPASGFHNLTLSVVKRFKECLKSNTLRFCAYSYRPLAGESGMQIHGSIYYPFVKDWMDVFGANQMLVIRAEDYYADRVLALNKVFKFLALSSMDDKLKRSIEDSFIANTKKVNRRSLEEMDQKSQSVLNAFFEPFNAKMAEFMRNPDWHWR